MQLCSSCKTLPKPEKIETNINEFYFPSFPELYKDGKPVIDYYKSIIIEGKEYEDVYVVPLWYMLQIANYAHETEANLQSLSS